VTGIDIHERRAAVEATRRLRRLRLPYTAREVLSGGLARLKAVKESRVWGLGETKLVDEVNHYHQRMRELAIKGPLPTLREAIPEKFVEEAALQLDAAANFLELSREADPYVRPILLYYSCAHACGVYTRAFFDWKCDARSHGITCSHKPRDPTATEIQFKKQGLFPRLASALYILSGWPNCFSSLVTCSTGPTFHTEEGGLLARFCKEERGDPIEKLTLKELSEFDYSMQIRNLRLRHGFHIIRALPGTTFLIDFAFLFAASSMARYDILGWRAVLNGESNALRLEFDDVFDRWERYGFRAVLAALENPTVSVDSPLTAAHPSPYSHRDTMRFPVDPNWSE
jgi:hypothetical protein